MFRKFMSLLLVCCLLLGSVSMAAVAAETCEHSYDQYGNCILCGDYCIHEWDAQGWCALCGNSCGHDYVDSVCSICGLPCAHDMEGNLCRLCGLTCDHEAHTVKGLCTNCGTAVPHHYEATVTEPTCETAGYTTYTCACGDSYVGDEVAAAGHQYLGGKCTVCGAADDGYVADYYLIGYINGADYGCESDSANLGQYKFVNGQVVATFTETSYVFVKTGDNVNWYMTNGWQGEVNSATLYTTDITGENSNKLYVPGGVEVTFTLVENADGSLTLSYEEHSHTYEATVTAPTCTEDGYTTYTCACGDSYTETISSTGHNYEETVVAPTCTENGYTAHTCACGDSYTTDETPATGHTFVDGNCVHCGASNGSSSENEGEQDELPLPVVTAKSFTLSFEDEVLVNFYYTVSDMTNVVEHGMLVFYTNPTSSIYELADVVYNDPTYDSARARYGVTTDGIPAKAMGDTRYYVGFAKLSYGVYVYSDMYEYSPKKYSMNMLNKASTSEKQKALCVAMLNYGAAAQSYFGYNTHDLMNSELTAEQQALVIPYDKTLFVGTVAADANKLGDFTATATGFSKKSATVSFEGAFCVNYYFTPDTTVSGDMTLYIWTPEAYASADVLTAANAAETMTMVPGSDGRYWGQVSGIAAKCLDETYYVAGVYTDAHGNTYCTGVVAYSLSKYCISKAVDGNEMQELAAATAMYGYYAKQYFTV